LAASGIPESECFYHKKPSFASDVFHHVADPNLMVRAILQRMHKDVWFSPDHRMVLTVGLINLFSKPNRRGAEPFDKNSFKKGTQG